MTETPAKTRKAAERERKRALGLRPVQFWLKPAEAAKVRELVAKLERKRG